MTTTTTTAENVADTLADHPEGVTTRELADASGVSLSTIAKTLTAMEGAGTARRVPGDTSNGRRSPDKWYPVADATDADESAADEATVEKDATDEPAANDTPAPTSADEPQAAAGTTQTSGDTAPPSLPEAPTSGAPVRPHRTDLKVLLMAEVLADHPDGVTADDAIRDSGLAISVAESILIAMEIVGAAYRLPVTDDGTELWVPVDDADLTDVDPGNAPAFTCCPTCGQARRVRTTSRAIPRATTATAPAYPASKANGNGSAKLAPGQLTNMVEAFMRNIGPGHDLTPGTVARELGRSSGACRNSMSKLTGPGVLIMTSATPETYAVSETAPAPSAAVMALMTPPLIEAPSADTTAVSAPSAAPVAA